MRERRRDLSRPNARYGGVGIVFAGRLSTRNTALGAANAPPCGAVLPTTDAGTMTAVMTEPGTLAPAIGLLVDVPAMPRGTLTENSTGVLVPAAVTTTRIESAATLSRARAKYVPMALYARFATAGASGSVSVACRVMFTSTFVARPTPACRIRMPTLPAPGSAAASGTIQSTRPDVEPVRATPV